MNGLIRVLTILMLTACVQKEVINVNLKGKKVLMVIAPSNFRDEEYFQPKQVLESTGAEITTASTTTQEATGMLGKKTTPDLKVSETNASHYDAIIFVGGSGIDQHQLFNNGNYKKLAKEALNSGKVLGAICLAPKILASAGLLQGKKATVYSSGATYIKSKGANYTEQDVVKDGKIITANGPKAATKFGEQIAKELTS